MKVLSISTDRGIFDDSSAVYARSLEYAKRTEEFHVVVFTLKHEKHAYKNIGNLHIYPTSSLSQWLYVWNAIKLSKKIVRSNSFIKGASVVSTQDPFLTGWVGMKIAGMFSFPLQIQIHTDFLSSQFSKSFFNIIRLIIAKTVIPKADGIRVVSDTIRSSLLKTYENITSKINVLPVYVDIKQIMNAIPEKDLKIEYPQLNFIISMASRLTKEKRIGDAIHALSIVVEKFPHTGLVIAGTGPELDRLRESVQKYNLARNVAFVGWQKDLFSYYKTSNLFLLTSEYEGYGMTLVEAGASGCPIVTTKVGLAKSDLFLSGENSFVCPVGDVDCIAKSISELIEDNSKRELFKRVMQDSIKKSAISKEEYTIKYIALLEQLIHND